MRRVTVSKQNCLSGSQRPGVTQGFNSRRSIASSCAGLFFGGMHFAWFVVFCLSSTSIRAEWNRFCSLAWTKQCQPFALWATETDNHWPLFVVPWPIFRTGLASRPVPSPKFLQARVKLKSMISMNQIPKRKVSFPSRLCRHVVSKKVSLSLSARLSSRLSLQKLIPWRVLL